MKGPDITRWEGSSEPRRTDLERRLKEEGFAPYSWADAPGAHYPDHQHAGREVRWVLRGRITIGVGSEQWTLGPGDRIDMPPRTVHWARAGDEGVEYLCGDGG